MTPAPAAPAQETLTPAKGTTAPAAEPEQTPPSLLPTEKTPSQIDPLRKKILLYGPPKIGKSTLVAQLNPDHTLFLATEPGLDALEVFKVDITSWRLFRQLCAEIVGQVEAGTFPHKVIAIDTVDALAALCADDVLTTMSGGGARFVHASDFEYGKGWSAIETEFKLRIAKLCNLGIGVVFISHAKEGAVKKANGAEVTKIGPDVGQKGIRKWLLGFVDYIFMCDIHAGPDGEERVIRTQPTENVEAGGRVPPGVEPLPELIPLNAENLTAALERVASA